MAPGTRRARPTEGAPRPPRLPPTAPPTAPPPPATLPAAAALLTLSAGLAFAAGPAAAQSDARAQEGDLGAPAEHEVARVEEEIEVDAVLDEPAWSRASTVRLPWESSPGRNAEAPVGTECRFLHDRDRLYVGCRASDPEPGGIRAHLADRDTPFDDDWMRLVLDPFGDRRQGYEFRVNPLGVQMDALVTTVGSDFAWDGIWASDGRITGAGYVVEMAIPFRTLNFPEGEGRQRWGVLVGRSWPRSETHRLRSIRTDYDDRCELCQADRLTGLRPGRSGHGIELNPTLTTSRTDERPGLTAPSLETGSVDLEPGLTGTWRPGPNLQVSGTANPDFSQVEADAALLESNRRFALFFPEKRPFFLQRSDVFQVPSNLIFTRSVVDPAAGLKMTGKTGANTAGVFVTRDRVNRLVLPGATSSSDTLLEDDVTGLVGRWQRDVGEASTVSLAATAREGDGYHNRMLSTDGILRLGTSTQLVYQLAGARTDYPRDVAEAFGQPEDGMLGYLGAAQVSHATRDWRAQGTLLDFSPDFRADAGFVTRTGFRRARYFVARTFWTPELPWATRFTVDSDGVWDVDHDGRLLGREVDLTAGWNGPLQSRVQLDLEWSEERFGGRTFSLPRPSLDASIRPSGALEAGFGVTVGEGIDFANARRADRLRLAPRLEWRAGRHLALEASHDLERLSDDGGAFLEENVTELRARWHFSKEAFLRGVVQHRDVDRAPRAFGEGTPREARSFFGQFLFSYEPTPRTALFVGYTDTRRGAEIGERDLDLRPTRRTFFTKLSYAWQF